MSGERFLLFDLHREDGGDATFAIDVAQVVEGAGAAALTVHGRTAQDMFTGSADWEKISAIKPHLKRIPLIGNGDLDSAAKVVAAFERYAVDGIMIARGDMGVAVPVHEVPIIQKQIIKKCNTAKKFVITATQMLEHMTEHSRPTRAEVTDVANAIIDGTDFVMLSAETAVGRFPYESVLMMNEIIKFTEKAMPGL